jgi:TM2 domain-containing membrane protein YozV
MKDKSTAAILALFMGGIGVHKFYLGRIGAGIAYLVFAFTFVPALLGLIDFFILALMDQDEFNRRYNSHALQPGVVVNMLPPPYPPPHGYPYPPPYPPPTVHPSHAHPGGMYPPPGMPHPGMQQQQMPHQPHQGQQQPMQSRSLDELAAQLERLNELRIAGLLTDEEFAQQKARLLASM